MTLCAAGPLVALADRDEAGHAACAAALPDLSIPLLTTWPAFTEAMDLADATLRAVAEEGGLRRIFNP